MKRALMLLTIALVLAVGCPNEHYYFPVISVTHYKIDEDKAVVSKLGVHVIREDAEVTKSFLDLVDEKTLALEKCLNEKNLWDKINYSWIWVYVPKDWYVSICSGEQLVPSKVNPQLCLNKGLDLPEECFWVEKPTTECPCVCNVRAVIQDNSYIVTTPNLKLYKAELVRLILGVNNPWGNEEITSCLGE